MLSLSDLTANGRALLARILKQILVAYDELWGISFPYIMAMHQRPSDGADYSDIYRFHIEFYPPLRTEEKLKFLAGSESGAGVFINDTLAEEKAAELRTSLGRASDAGITGRIKR